MGLKSVLVNVSCQHESFRSVTHLAAFIQGIPVTIGDSYALNLLAKPAKSHFYKLNELLNFSAPYMIRQ
jgi:hypothetical protein